MDLNDYVRMAENWRDGSLPPCLEPDLSGGVTGIDDLMIIAGNWLNRMLTKRLPNALPLQRGCVTIVKMDIF